jgi:hypothetical protein
MRFITGMILGFVFGVLYTTNAFFEESGFLKTILEVLVK